MTSIAPTRWWRGLAGLTRSGSATEGLSWALYDFANTIFSFAIVSYAMSLWSIRFLGEAGGQFWFTFAVSVSVLINAAVSPVLGAMSDRTGRRKPYLGVFTALAIAPTLFIGFVNVGIGLLPLFFAIPPTWTEGVLRRREVADALVAEEKRGGGIITLEDLRRYKPEWRTPIRSTYRGYTLLTMPPSSSGGITMTETLNILETFAPLPKYGTAAYTHLLTEAFRRAFIDRNEKLGDPAFVKVPMEQLTSKAYARQLASGIDRMHATVTPAFKAGAEPDHTTHYSVVDNNGNAVATTTTLNGGYGSGVWIRGGGFFMNNEMDDFAAQPGTPNMFGLVQGEANAIAPGKRMLSAMAPTIVLDPPGKVLLVTGAAGGPTIITATMEVILNVIEHHMTLADAMRAPRLHHQALPDQLDFEPNGLTTAVQDSLKAMGHKLGTRGLATANSIMRVRGGLEGVGEPRSGSGGRVLALEDDCVGQAEIGRGAELSGDVPRCCWGRRRRIAGHVARVIPVHAASSATELSAVESSIGQTRGARQ